MPSIRTIFFVSCAFALGFVAHAEEEIKTETKKQTFCPVMERYEIDATTYIDVKGYRIYTCCKGCINQIKANPDKYIKRLENKGIEIEKTPLEDRKAKQGNSREESTNDT